LTNILDVQNLKTYFHTEAGIVKAIDGISLHVEKGETLGLVGESGSGKTMTALSVLNIIPSPGKINGGKILFNNNVISNLDEEQMRKIRGKKIALIFQDPTSSLHPLYTVGKQIADILKTHDKLNSNDAKNRVIELFIEVGIPEPKIRVNQYPHEFSGGMKQRVAIARALALNPELLFADEPTTNLDVTIQAQVLDLLKHLKKSKQMSLIIITHDMGVVADITQRITVLYAGMVAEIANTKTLFKNPKHPYTRQLLDAVPRPDIKKRLEPIPGNIPQLISPPTGCRFHPRCKYAEKICSEKIPALETVSKNHLVSCHLWKKIKF
jgi:oligopeptide/dipeptide ABC transporter ATP-binding protein